jgi:hypothetical protein
VTVPTGQRHSPFRLEGYALVLSRERRARVALAEHDHARLGAARNPGTVLTANTNPTSTSTGCVVVAGGFQDKDCHHSRLQLLTAMCLCMNRASPLEIENRTIDEANRTIDKTNRTRITIL